MIREKAQKNCACLTCVKGVLSIHKFLSDTLSVIAGGLYTIISESKFTQPAGAFSMEK